MREEDKVEGFLGPRRAPSGDGASASTKLKAIWKGKRARAAWFNRPRGAGAVRLAAERNPESQRVIVKIKPVVHASVSGKGGAGGLMRHALYVEREGAGRDGDKVMVFDRELDEADGRAFVERCEPDRHHFRVIISPERGGELDLKSFTRGLMGEVERDLRSRLDWIAAEHHDTGRPHVHLLIRGKREDGQDLVIPRAYVSHGFRERAEAIATRELGPRLEVDVVRERLERAVRLEQFTGLDSNLLEVARGQVVAMADLAGPYRDVLVQRVTRLAEWGLAEPTGAGRWRLDSALEARLTRLGDERGRERATARLLASEDRGLEPERVRTLEDAHSLTRPTGRLVGFEPLEGNDRGPLLIGVEALDGRFWTARVARAEDLRVLQGVERGAIVCLHRAPPQLRPSDRTILEIAGEDRIYSADRHRAAAPSDRESYIRMHERRLEALRMDGIVERDGLGRFHLPRDFEAQVLVREGRGGRESARVQLLDPHALRTQRDYLGPTWLDRVLDGQEHLAEPAQTGFGREMREHLVGREEHLSGLGLLEAGGVLVEDWRDQLEALERKTILDRLERETGRVSHFAREGEKVHGIYVGRVLAGEGSFALIQQERTATLAPWRPELERARNQVIVGRVEGPQFDFQMGRAAEKAIGKGIDLWR